MRVVKKVDVGGRLAFSDSCIVCNHMRAMIGADNIPGGDRSIICRWDDVAIRY